MTDKEIEELRQFRLNIDKYCFSCMEHEKHLIDLALYELRELNKQRKPKGNPPTTIKNEEIIRRIELFILDLNAKHPDIAIGYKYCDECIGDEYYWIYHNSEKAEEQEGEESFSSYAGELLSKYFWDDRIFNISFGYKYKLERGGRDR